MIFMLDMVNNVLGRAGASDCIYLLSCGGFVQVENQVDQSRCFFTVLVDSVVGVERERDHGELLATWNSACHNL